YPPHRTQTRPTPAPEPQQAPHQPPEVGSPATQDAGTAAEPPPRTPPTPESPQVEKVKAPKNRTGLILGGLAAVGAVVAGVVLLNQPKEKKTSFSNRAPQPRMALQSWESSLASQRSGGQSTGMGVGN
ncbi:MAG: hypothetical protein ACOYJ2_08080, partial [Rickettsiales bacterium]